MKGKGGGLTNERNEYERIKEHRNVGNSAFQKVQNFQLVMLGE